MGLQDLEVIGPPCWRCVPGRGSAERHSLVPSAKQNMGLELNPPLQVGPVTDFVSE